MRFSLLPIGDRFEFQNETYSKSGPLTAVNLKNNQQRMIPRSSLVTPLSATTATQPTTPTVKRLDAEAVSAAFTQYHQACLQLLSQDVENGADLQETLEQMRQQFLTDCGLN
jgi:hypothetical protein